MTKILRGAVGASLGGALMATPVGADVGTVTPPWAPPISVKFYTAVPRDSTANGLAITQLTDYSGSANDATQGTAGLRATMQTTGINSNKAAQFASASSQRYALPSAVTGASRGISAFLSWLPQATIPIPNNTLALGSSQYVRIQGNYQGGGQLSINGLAFSSVTANFITPFLTALGVNVLGYRSGTALQKLTWNGIRYAFVYLDAYTTAPAGGGVGGDTSGGFYNGLIQDVLIDGSTVSDANSVTILNQLKAVANPTWYTPTWQIVHDGDSLTYGAQNVNAFPYPAQLFRMFNLGDIHGANLGWPGSTLSQMSGRASATDSLYDNSLTQNVLCVWIGTNDITGGGTTAATEYAALQTYIANRQTTGWLPVVLTMISRNLGASDETQRTTYNADILGSGWVVADVGGDSQLGQQTSSLNQLLFQTDATHLNDDGYYIVACYARDAVVGNYGLALAAAPTNLVASPLASTIRLNWDGTTQKYNVWRGTAHGGPYTKIASNVAARTYTDTPPSTGVTYYYVVTAVNNIGEGSNSNEASTATAVNGWDPSLAAAAPKLWGDASCATQNDKIGGFRSATAWICKDLSSQGIHPVQATFSKRPIVGYDSNGKAYLRFSRPSQQALVYSGLAAGMQTADATYWVVFRMQETPPSDNAFLVDFGGGSQEAGIFVAPSTRIIKGWTHNTSNTAYTVTGTIAATVGTLYLAVLTHDGTNQLNKLYVNGTQTGGNVSTTGTLGWGASPAAWVGGRLAGTTAFTTGDIYEFGEHPGVLTSTELSNLLAYVQQKYPS